ncbi:Aldo-keto reductase [Roseibacterium elongatum DSM 19469]|uniref:Aldo-keto reductase n=1 Tax=Roseicyclus elongatus DSM 19469 TaxID=1294273 RepID=W8RSD2_9RHOB|nr:aldo/keto reductase [Roseibacterium elongatum]AHM04084.1 Aldo-keto reductase [Roseibacterium elongatum DSM 19469]
MKLKRRIAGQKVGAVGLGCMSFGGVYGATTEGESHACLAAAIDLGITHWDVAEIYGMGISERAIGAYLAQTNAPVTLATKAGIYPKPTRHFRNDAEALRRSLEGSLERLGRDSVDLFYIHRREADRPIEEVMETLAGFIAEGLIGAIGLSEVAPATLRRAHAVHPVAAVQSEYSLWTRQPELGMIQTCAELGVTFVAFSPVGRGIFADRFPRREDFPPEDFRQANPRFVEPNFSANKAAIAPFQDWCRARGWSTAATAVAWTLAQGDHILPIPGTRTAANLRDLVRADDIVLSAQDLAEIEAILPAGFAHGDRYSDAQYGGVERYC